MKRGKKVSGMMLCLMLVAAGAGTTAAAVAAEEPRAVQAAAAENDGKEVRPVKTAQEAVRVYEEVKEVKAGEIKEETAAEEQGGIVKKETANALEKEDSKESAEKTGEYTVSEVRFTADGLLILPRPVKEGKVFVEWNTREDGTGTGYKAGETVDPTDIVLYSIWKDPEDGSRVGNRKKRYRF